MVYSSKEEPEYDQDVKTGIEELPRSNIQLRGGLSLAIVTPCLTVQSSTTMLVA
jgi:hypothetical protein